MNKLLKILTEVALIIPLFCVTVLAMDVEYVGSISDGLFAPTSIDVSDDQLAVLEPFSRQITTYTIEGVLRQKINIEGDASGLARLSEYEYLFCDRYAGKIVSVNMLTGSQMNFLEGGDIHKPVDLINKNARIYILDAGSGEILISGLTGAIEIRLALVKPNGDRIGFASSFAYDRDREVFYVLDQVTSIIWIIGADGQFLGDFC
ncbi:MAG: hypothetical protein V3W18_00190, partial [candidate division Zixibacteria bacterium]